MNHSLVREIFEAGLLELGHFESALLGQPAYRPIRLRFDLLPSYPDFLQRLADEAVQVLKTQALDRLVCTADAVPLGVAVSLQMNLPLVYSRGQGEPATTDLVGAYDVGHPACLLTNTLADGEGLFKVIRGATGIGLRIQSIWAITDFAPYPLHQLLPIHVLLPFEELIRNLQEISAINTRTTEHILEWYQGKQSLKPI